MTPASSSTIIPVSVPLNDADDARIKLKINHYQKVFAFLAAFTVLVGGVMHYFAKDWIIFLFPAVMIIFFALMGALFVVPLRRALAQQIKFSYDATFLGFTGSDKNGNRLYAVKLDRGDDDIIMGMTAEEKNFLAQTVRERHLVKGDKITYTEAGPGVSSIVLDIIRR